MGMQAAIGVLRRGAARQLTVPCTITRAGTPTSDNAGGRVPGTLTTTTTTCHIDDQVGMILANADAVRALGRYRITLPVESDVKVKDTLATAAASYTVVFAPPVEADDPVRHVGADRVGS